MKAKDTARFVSKIAQRGDDDCWEWLAGKSSRGYGAFWLNGTTVTASRVAYCLWNGKIPRQLWVLHKCDNPPCVNPAHLFLGTVQDNVDDMFAKGRENKVRGDTHYLKQFPEKILRGEQVGTSKLCAEDVREIRRRVAAGEVQRRVADEYGIGYMEVSRIVRKLRWAHVD